MPDDLDLRLVVAALATFRVASMFASEDGPWCIFKRLRTYYADRFLGDMVSCLWCVSVWIGVLATVLVFTPLWIAMLPLALSATVVILGRWAGLA